MGFRDSLHSPFICTTMNDETFFSVLWDFFFVFICGFSIVSQTNPAKDKLKAVLCVVLNVFFLTCDCFDSCLATFRLKSHNANETNSQHIVLRNRLIVNCVSGELLEFHWLESGRARASISQERFITSAFRVWVPSSTSAWRWNVFVFTFCQFDLFRCCEPQTNTNEPTLLHDVVTFHRFLMRSDRALCIVMNVLASAAVLNVFKAWPTR